MWEDNIVYTLMIKVALIKKNIRTKKTYSLWKQFRDLNVNCCHFIIK